MNNSNLKGTLLTQNSLDDLAKLVKWVEVAKKELKNTLDLFSEPISQRVLSLRTMIQKSGSALEKIRKEIDSTLKDGVTDHNNPNYETGVLSLNFVSSIRKGWNQKQADEVKKRLDNFRENCHNNFSEETITKVNGYLNNNGLGADFFDTLNDVFPPLEIEKVQVK